MVIASLPILGTLATRIRFEYLDKQEQSLSFFACITAPAASGKSFIRKPLDLLLTPINEQDAIEREKEQAYKEKLRASKNSKNQPEDPHACPRNNGVAISIAKLLQLLTLFPGIALPKCLSYSMRMHACWMSGVKHETICDYARRRKR